ncbi:MAG: pyruvate, water dikinase regulatory protein [Dethiobacteria bacterium]|jgi:regulator of PEP synthase PpsR (kinase-PPPase family)|nr:pyruvate, water dikinase regulatory protein [Bacillota bacterium]NMD33735.1 kinase/pyrophosphorylase [Bacillota bacterium]HOB29220.1 pyruvate, water dikinase regulatory protein [Bacillota bacterium]HPZ41832.1 pyruvate, water dikinase regulatory protein [Bacillota bacterium]HQD52728.1 pyruvate, water dikinase regulatory protein [Bacillota bacterium]
MSAASEKPVVYIISDSIGETAEFVIKAAASQYDSEDIEVRRVPFISDAAKIIEVLEEAAQANSMVAYTLVLPELRRVVELEAAQRNIPTADIMGPAMEAFAQIMKKEPYLEPGRVRRLDEDYFRRIAAVEFAVKYDDGKDPRGLRLAEVVLIGVSRTSKTPLSMYLAHRRLMVANLPLVPEVEPPEELFWVPSERIVGLMINPVQLRSIRQERLNSLGLDAQADYASMGRITAELEYARRIMEQIGCTVFDVSNKAVEEVANQIMQVIKGG